MSNDSFYQAAVSLASLGWQAFFQQQLSLDEWEQATPARVMEQHRSVLNLATEAGWVDLELTPTMPAFVVGDWLLLNKDGSFLRLLERKSCFYRKAAGTKLDTQLIAANVDTAFIVCAMNEDFNLNRLERLLALVNETRAEPVVILSKCDLVSDPEAYLNQVRRLDSGLVVESLNCLSEESVAKLSPWVNEGNTVAVLGSSGVGKSTLINTLLGQAKQMTNESRTDDDKGRHTTTRRSLFPLIAGGLVLDTPGMREIQLADCKEGISTTFADIEALAQGCRFNDCQHHSEPGCAVREAVDAGNLDQRRLNNYLKLLREDALNSKSLAQRRASDKALGKFYKKVQSEAKELKGR